MKRLTILFMVFSLEIAKAGGGDPLANLKQNLESMLETSAGRMPLKEIKVLANQKNTDIGVAFENYLIAKKKIWAARALFNPVTTGDLLGMSLGMTYLWGAIAAEAVLSIPTKIYNVKKSKYLSLVAMYNLYEARRLLNNELAHLYYDVLTHEVMLKTIDLEIQILIYQEEKWSGRLNSREKLEEVRKLILNLGLKRIDIYNLYAEELSAMRILLSTNESGLNELAQVPLTLDRSITTGIDRDSLQNFALANSDKYKGAINLELAAHSNLKKVQWSIISKEALSFTYRRRIKEARNEEQVASMRVEATRLEVKTNVILQLQKLGSSLELLDHFNSTSEDSLKYNLSVYEASKKGQQSVDDAIETSLEAVRDFRNKAVAHYQSWSSFDDFSTSANFDFVSTFRLRGKATSW
ncbi:MAG: hypothetical protein WC635_09015 [Bacteriovorax sp.]|jgi:hypothetical protein